jgi:hypothetical protein
MQMYVSTVQNGFKPAIVMQVCAWTADCAIPGCKSKCIANSLNLGFDLALVNYEFSESSYRMCPVMAIFLSDVLNSAGAGPAPLNRTSSRLTQQPSDDPSATSPATASTQFSNLLGGSVRFYRTVLLCGCSMLPSQCCPVHMHELTSSSAVGISMRRNVER